MAADLRELTFQNVVDTVLNPAGVKMGGFPEEIFTDLTDDEKEEWSCNICFLILKDTRHCDNKHQFCHTCIFAWSLTLGENSGKCPVCRCKQKKYTSHTPVDQLIGEKRVKCPETGCSFASPLKILLMHSHGKLTYSNANIDLESLRPPPQQMLMYAPLMHHPLRQQLSQGRMMINQMLLLLQLEMQLRQHALFNFTHSTDHSSRMHHADEMVALNEQLGEVGGIIGSLLNSSIDDAPRRRAARNRAQQADGAGSGESEGAGGGAATGRRIPRSDLPRVISFLGADNDALDSDSDSSGEGATSRLPTRSRVQLPSTRQTTPSNSNSTNQSGERRAVRITNPPGSNRGAELTLIFRRDGEIRRESTAAQTNNTDNSRVPRNSLTPRDNATSPRTPTTLPPITAQSDTHATPTLATSSPRVAHISTSASQPNTGAIVSPPSTSSALANTAQSSPSYAASTPPTPALSTATPSAARTIPNSVARAAAPSATRSLDRPASASRSTTPAVARSVPPPMLSHPRPPAREPPNPSSNTPTFSDGEDDDSSNTSALPNGSSTLRDVMQALNSETSTRTAERTTTIRRPPPRQNSSLVANISSASRRNSSSGSRPNTEQSATTEQLYESSERPAVRDSSQQNTYAPQRRFRRDSQSNRPVRASHDIDISNMNRLTNRNTTTRSRGSDRAPDGTSRPPETQRSRSQSNRRSSITAQLQRQDHRDDSPVPRPRRRSEIREELLKSRSNRE